jgi:flagellar P-ring protein precursor FlgI
MNNHLPFSADATPVLAAIPHSPALRDAEALLAAGILAGKLSGGNYSMPVRSNSRPATAMAMPSTVAVTPRPAFKEEAVWLTCVFTTFLFATLMLLCSAFTTPAHADARLKDIATFEGVRDNLLMGYGLVVGLHGTGDKLKNNEFTSQSLIAFLERQGVNTRGTELKSTNVAAVTVTATLPAFARSGGKISVTVSAMGDAKSLQGGMLLATALYGADGEVYAVAQGPISISDFISTGVSATVSRGVPTNGFITDGAIVEREINFSLNSMASLNIGLRNPDIATAKHIAEAINKHLGVDAAEMTDPGTVHLRVPIDFKGNTAQLLAEIEPLTVQTDQAAKVVIDEASGTIVMGEDVRVDTIAVAQGNLVVKVEEAPPPVVAAAAPGTPAAAATATPVSAEEGKNKMAIMPHGTSLRELVAGLNALGVGPRDLITILQSIKSAGALQAEIITK